ncbi:MAG: hypothetical protein PHT07_23085 [Paludibacter sp.]|nr:hypothetical protein [Paludibacter sp.]
MENEVDETDFSIENEFEFKGKKYFKIPVVGYLITKKTFDDTTCIPGKKVVNIIPLEFSCDVVSFIEHPENEEIIGIIPTDKKVYALYEIIEGEGSNLVGYKHGSMTRIDGDVYRTDI